jgi:hypothetical protein
LQLLQACIDKRDFLVNLADKLAGVERGRPVLDVEPNFLTVRPEIFERGAVIVPHVGLNNLLDLLWPS